jgi:hypothetical protein
MLKISLPEPSELHALNEEQLLEVIDGWAEVSADVERRRLSAIAHFLLRQCAYDGEPMEDRAYRLQAELALYADRFEEDEFPPG